MPEPVIIVSGDSHVGAEIESLREYFDPEFRPAIDDQLVAEQAAFLAFGSKHVDLPDDVLELIDDQHAIRTDGELGAWDFDRRLTELDREGVAAEILYSGHQCSSLPFFSYQNNPYPAELRRAGARAHHRWLADGIAGSGGRLFGVADPGPCLDLDDSVAELHWVAEHGFRSVKLPRTTHDDALPPLYDRYYDPFWAACQDLGLVLGVHAGFGGKQGAFAEFCKQFEALVVGNEGRHKKGNIMDMMGAHEDSPLKLDLGPRRAMWQLMLGGVLDRFPSLTLSLTEVRADWIPRTLAHLDARADRGDLALTMKPSEYWARNWIATPSSIHRCEIEMRDEIGVDNMVFATDYPHPESTWPNTVDWIHATFVGTTESEARRILGENAIRAYGLDRDHLASVAARIGLAPDALFGEFTVDPRRIEIFTKRAGLSRGPETVDLGAVDELLDQDVAALAAV